MNPAFISIMRAFVKKSPRKPRAGDKLPHGVSPAPAMIPTMLRSSIILLMALAAVPIQPLTAQLLRDQSFASTLAHPHRRDSIRLWCRYVSDSSLVLLIPREANAWLQRGYEFFIPIGTISNPVYINARSPHPDSLSLSCTASDYFNNGYRLHFVRERAGFRFCYVDEFQVFRSGVERLCLVRFMSADKPDRRVIRAVTGSGGCMYFYHRRLLASFPNCFYGIWPALSR